MTLLNDPASLPAQMWTVMRFALTCRQPMLVADAKSVLSPPTLLPADKSESDKTFQRAVANLRALRMLSDDNESIVPTEAMRSVAPNDVASFAHMLQRQILDPCEMDGIGRSGDQTGAKDLIRALAWFLTLDPIVGYAWNDVVQLQENAFAQEVGLPFANDFRWNRFVSWAPALGFAEIPLIGGEGRANRLSPDCTTAVRRIVGRLWNPETHVPADQFVSRLLTELPVLLGGSVSNDLGLTPATSGASAALSHALMCGHDQGWLRVDFRSDAIRDITLNEPGGGTRRITDVTVLEGVS